jgi:hypothetical protein
MQDVATRSAVQSMNGQQRGAGRNGSSRAEILIELLNLRDQLEQIALTPAVTQAHRLTAQVAQVLEPVWSVVTASAEANTDGVGYLRRYGVLDRVKRQSTAAVSVSLTGPSQPLPNRYDEQHATQRGIDPQ